MIVICLSVRQLLAVKSHFLLSTRDTTDKSSLETRWGFVAMAGDWSVAMAGRKIVKESVKVRSLY